MVLVCWSCFFFKQKTAYEMRISDWSSDVCSSDLRLVGAAPPAAAADQPRRPVDPSAPRPGRVSPIEGIAAALVLINVALVALRSVWNYPFALVAVTL